MTMEYVERWNAALEKPVEKIVHKTVVVTADERHFRNSGGSTIDKFNI